MIKTQLNFKTMKLVLILAIFLSKLSMAQDTLMLSKMTGTWRWVSGNRDTFIMTIKPVKAKIDKNGRAIQVDFFSYHTYIEKGQLVESSMLASDDTIITNHTTLSGYAHSDKIFFGLYDITRDNRISYLLQLIGNRTDVAWLTNGGMDHRWVTDDNKKMYPPGKTIPTDIVLKKIPVPIKIKQDTLAVQPASLLLTYYL